MTVIKEKWTFFVSIMENKPYELIGGLSKYVSIPKRVKNGKILKYNGTENPVARYDLHYDYDRGPDEETIIRDITNAFETPCGSPSNFFRILLNSEVKVYTPELISPLGTSLFPNADCKAVLTPKVYPTIVKIGKIFAVLPSSNPLNLTIIPFLFLLAL